MDYLHFEVRDLSSEFAKVNYHDKDHYSRHLAQLK